MSKILTLVILMCFNQTAISKINKSSDKEIECLAHNIYHESRGEPYKGRLSVALVVMNRIKSNKYPDNACDVIKQKGQFSWVGKKSKPKDTIAFLDSKKIAEYVYNNHENINDPTNGALYFNSGKGNYSIKRTAVIGKHKFYK